MTLSEVKTFFRTVIKVVAGGPAVGTPGQNRAAGVLAALDKLAEFAEQGTSTPEFDIYGATQAKTTQVLGFFTSATQRTAVDQPLSGDTSTRLGSRIPDVANGDVYELMPDKANPMPDPTSTTGATIATPTWIRYGL